MFSYKKYILLFVAALCVVFSSCRKSQVSAIQSKYFIKYFGGSGTQAAYHVEATSDGGYILIGTTDSKGNGGNDMFVVKTDEFGNEIWANTYGGGGDDEGKCVREVNGGYVLLGTLENSGDKQIYFLLIDADGNVINTQTYGTIGKDDEGTSIRQDKDGGYLIVGTTQNVNTGKAAGSTVGIDLTDIILIKTNSSGVEVWNGVYGLNSPDQGTAIHQVNDTIFYTSGIVNPGNSNPAVNNMLVTKSRVQSSTTLNVINSLTDGSPINQSMIAGATDVTVEGDVVKILGYTDVAGAQNIFFLQYNEVTTASTFQTYGGSQDEQAFGFNKCSDGGYIIAGYTMSEGEGGKDIYLLKIDANGFKQWSKTFGGEADDIGYSVVQTSDGGYAICGSITFGGNGIGANPVMSLIKTDENGELKGK